MKYSLNEKVILDSLMAIVYLVAEVAVKVSSTLELAKWAAAGLFLGLGPELGVGCDREDSLGGRGQSGLRNRGHRTCCRG